MDPQLLPGRKLLSHRHVLSFNALFISSQGSVIEKKGASEVRAVEKNVQGSHSQKEN